MIIYFEFFLLKKDRRGAGRPQIQTECPAAHYKICPPPLIIRCLKADKLASHQSLLCSLAARWSPASLQHKHRDVHQSVPLSLSAAVEFRVFVQQDDVSLFFRSSYFCVVKLHHQRMYWHWRRYHSNPRRSVGAAWWCLENFTCIPKPCPFSQCGPLFQYKLLALFLMIAVFFLFTITPFCVIGLVLVIHTNFHAEGSVTLALFYMQILK